MTDLSHAPASTLVQPDLNLSGAWDDLAARSGASPFAYPGWVHAMVDSFGGDLRLIVARNGCEIVGVSPLVGHARLATPTGWHTPWHEAVAVDSAARRSMWSAALAANAIVVDHVLADGEDARVVTALATDRGLITRVRDRQAPPFIELDGDWDSYEASMASKRRSDLRRRMRRLGEIGDVSFEVVDGTVELERRLDEGFAVEGSGWKGREGTAVGAGAETDRFYRLVARWASERGWLRLAFLRLDGRAVAFDFSLETGGRHYLLKTGFDESLRSHAPGALLRKEMIRYCFGEGLDFYEFTGDVAPWKQEWTSNTRQTVCIEAYSTGPIGRGLWAASRTRRLATGAVRRVLGGR